MRKLYKEKKEFNKAYIPVIISTCFLVILLAVLIFVIIYNPDNDASTSKTTKTLSDGEYAVDINEQSMDSSKTTCDSSKKKKIISAASAVDVIYKETTVESEELYAEFGDDSDEGYHMEMEALEIDISGITSSIYVSISNSANDDSYTFTTDDLKDGIASFVTDDVENVVTYTVKVYATSSDCKGDLYRKFTFKTPKYNIMYDLSACIDNDSSYCDKYTYDTFTIDDITDSNSDYDPEEYNGQEEKIDKAAEEKEKSKESESTNDNIIYIVVGIIALVLIVGIIIFIILKNKHKKVN